MAEIVEVIQLGSLCIENNNFTAFVTEDNNDNPRDRPEVSQSQAIIECESFDGSTLGPIVNRDEFNAVRNILAESTELFPFNRTTETHFIGFFVGLQAFGGQPPGRGDTFAFTFVENSFNQNSIALEFYHVNQGQFPWNEGEPSNALNDQNCGQIFFANNEAPGLLSDGLLDDVNCETSNGFICRGPCFENDIEEEEDTGEEEDENNERIGLNVFLFVGFVACCILFAFLSATFLKDFRKLKRLQRSLINVKLS